jgi:phosphoribosylaminoimidazolecarboxamide formyltransferase/IMP cyclohydrolase
MEFPDELRLTAKRAVELRYGENPHQQAALYIDAGSTRPSAPRSKQLQGKELSFNNIADADAAFECVAEFEKPAVVIVKHLNPCGAAQSAAPLSAYQKALACDPVSAFGGIIALNRPLESTLALELSKIFLEVIIAPKVEKDALSILSKKENLRILETRGMPDPRAEEASIRSVAGGFLVQTRDSTVLPSELKVVTKRQPSPVELEDMKFAFTVCKHVKSNAIVHAKDGATLAIGAGQMSRIDSAKLAVQKAADAKQSLQGSVMASDAFMPFPDVVEVAAEGRCYCHNPAGRLQKRPGINRRS